MKRKKYAKLRDECGCIICPACDRLYEFRKKGRCPLCGVKLVHPDEYFSLDEDGYFFAHGDWHKISEVRKNKEV
jgi:hypothetical protein